MPINDHRNSERVSIVVAIHNAFNETRTCLESLRHHLPRPHRVLLVDDASSDRRVWPLLEQTSADQQRFSAYRNEKNLGYTATVNHGCQLAGPDDVVLLNSDTVVTSGWLDKLRSTAHSRPRVATVTPLSNAAGAFSVPVRGQVNRLPPGISIERMGHLLEQCSEHLHPEVPTGHGFCLFIRRQAMDAVDTFNVDTFRHGCGEENDFCMRASNAGFVHLIDDATFIFHRQSASLGWRKRWLLLRGRYHMRRLHPTYEKRVARWLDNDPLDGLRARLADALRDA